MILECKKANLPEPEFKVNGNFVVVTFRYGSQNQTSTPQVVSLIQIIQKGTYSVKETVRAGRVTGAFRNTGRADIADEIAGTILSIEGYRVTDELISKVKSGAWKPDGDDAIFPLPTFIHIWTKTVV